MSNITSFIVGTFTGIYLAQNYDLPDARDLTEKFKDYMRSIEKKKQIIYNSISNMSYDLCKWFKKSGKNQKVIPQKQKLQYPNPVLFQLFLPKKPQSQFSPMVLQLIMEKGSKLLGEEQVCFLERMMEEIYPKRSSPRRLRIMSVN